MSWLEVNKILASIIVAVIIVSLISIFGDILINQNMTQKAKNAYLIEIDEEDSGDVAEETQSLEIEEIAVFLSSASSDNGEKLFKKCTACHTYEKDGANKVGPNLWGLINNQKANVEGFAYSQALAETGGKWGYEELNNFLYKPKEYIKGTKMNFSGLKKIEERADLILFLRDQAEPLAPLP